jgi:nitrous-oxide reductase
VGDVKIRMGDAHHPALSETNGDYDGQWVFINDKANARVAVIDLRDFRTKQIVKDPNVISDHGGPWSRPTRITSSRARSTPRRWAGNIAPISEYKEKYRGVITLWKFDREQGRIIPEESFSIEAAALLAGPLRRGQTGQRRLGLLQLASTPRWPRAATWKATRSSRPA